MLPNTLSNSSPALLRLLVVSAAACATAIGLATLPPEVHAKIHWPPPEPVQQRVEDAVQLIAKLEELVPKPIGDLNAQAFEFEFDIEAVAHHVTNDIRYEPYSGVLRGPDGTASLGAGNAWDQALLLAALIKTVGADAQIVGGTLSLEDAERLLEEALRSVPSTSEIEVDHEAIAELLGELGPQYAAGYRETIEGLDSTAASGLLETGAGRISGELVRLIDRSQDGFSPTISVRPLVERIAQDYVWVRWRLGQGDEWSMLHPAFGRQQEPEVEAERYFDAEVPAEFQHRVSLQLFIERGTESGSAGPELVPVMSEWDRPTANLFKNQVYIGMAPKSIDDAAESAVLVPVLNGGAAPGSQAVTRLGLTADSADISTNAGRLFATVSSRGSTATSALGGLTGDGPAEERKLLGVVLRVVLKSPDGVRTIDRRVADLRGTPMESFPISGMFQMVVDVHVGAESPQSVYHEMLAYFPPLIRAVPPMMALARNAISVPEMESSRAYRDLGQPRWFDFRIAAGALVAEQTENSSTFRTGPMLASRRTRTMPDGRLRTLIDIFSNPSTTLKRGTDGTIEIDIAGSIRQGARETLVESMLAGQPAGWSERRPTALIQGTTGLTGSRFEDWPKQAVEAARADLEAGYLLALVDDAENHWWRVDPTSGETLGMSTHGGSEFAEYLIATAGVAISVALFAYSVQSCDEQYADNQDMADCCIVGNLGLTYATSAGSAVGQAATTTGNALYAASGSLKAALGWTAADIGTGLVVGNAVDGVGAACRAYLDQN